MLPNPAPLTRRDAVVVAGRVVCVFLLFWAVANLSSIPGMILSVRHYYLHANGTNTGNDYYTYWTRQYFGYIGGALLRSTVEVWIAGYFYRCGPKIAGFLLPPDPASPQPAEDFTANA